MKIKNSLQNNFNYKFNYFHFNYFSPHESKLEIWQKYFQDVSINSTKLKPIAMMVFNQSGISRETV